MSDTDRPGDQARDDAPTDEIELPREPHDRTRVMPAASSDSYSRTEPYAGDASTDAAETKAYSLGAERNPSWSHETAQNQAAQNPGAQSQRAQYRPAQYQGEFGQAPSPLPAQQPPHVGQYGYAPHPEAIRKGPSGVARLISVVINLLLTALIIAALWDYRGVQRMDSVIMNSLMDFQLPLALLISIIPMLVGVLALLSGLTVAISGLGAGLFGTLLFLAGVVLSFLNESGGNNMALFLGMSLPVLFPVALLMMGAGIGAHFARRAGAKRVLRAYSPRY